MVASVVKVKYRNKYLSLLLFILFGIISVVSFAAIIDIVLMHPILCLLAVPGLHVLFCILVGNKDRDSCKYCVIVTYLQDRRKAQR